MGSFTRNTAIVIAVTQAGMSARQAAERFGVSPRWVYTLLSRYEQDGVEGLRPRSTAPRSRPNATSEHTVQTITALRADLARAGLDAGPASIHARLPEHERPSITTIWRVLSRQGLITPQPHKRPRSSWHRFEAAQPNECWQSDFTHYTLPATTTSVEIISWLDDHSRYLLHISAHTRVTGATVVDTFTSTARTHDLPASTLTDNGMVYTTRLSAGRTHNQPNAFETLLADLGVTQKNGAPAHPTTQGKIERFHQTLKRWLDANCHDTTIEELATTLTTFQHVYNTTRPHRALGGATPHTAYHATDKAFPTMTVGNQPWRVRYDTVTTEGKITLRYAGKLRHLAIGRAWKHQPVIALVHGPDTIIIATTTGEIIAEHTIDPTRDYQPKKPTTPTNTPQRH